MSVKLGKNVKFGEAYAKAVRAIKKQFVVQFWLIVINLTINN